MFQLGLKTVIPLPHCSTRVPYWAAVAQLEMLILIIVEVFSSGLTSVVQQAALLQVTGLRTQWKTNRRGG